MLKQIDDVVKLEQPLKQDTEGLFIYENDDLFNYDEITLEYKKFNCILLSCYVRILTKWLSVR